MKRFTFDEVTDFSNFFDGNNSEITDAIVDGIKEAIEAETDEAELFELGFNEEDDFFEVTLEKGEWPQALSACMTKYEESERYDDVIEAYELLKKATDLL
jgi:multimeric flavodoxin WrbA